MASCTYRKRTGRADRRTVAAEACRPLTTDRGDHIFPPAWREPSLRCVSRRSSGGEAAAAVCPQQPVRGDTPSGCHSNRKSVVPHGAGLDQRRHAPSVARSRQGRTTTPSPEFDESSRDRATTNDEGRARAPMQRTSVRVSTVDRVFFQSAVDSL